MRAAPLTACRAVFNAAAAVALAVLSIACVPAHAVTFDCSKATNPDENTICSEVALSQLDNDLRNAYKLNEANLPLPMRDYLQKAEARWEGTPASPRSGACKGDIACITRKYQARMEFLANPGFRFEGVYASKKGRIAVESTASGALRIGFFPDGAATAVLAFDESRGLKVAQRTLVLPQPAENCAMQVEFPVGESKAIVYAKEAKKKACDGVKRLIGTYDRDYGLIPGK
jgi:uncharacterized protein